MRFFASAMSLLIAACSSAPDANRNPENSTANGNVAISQREALAEASALIPPDWRERVRHVRSFHLPSDCGGPDPFNFIGVQSTPMLSEPVAFDLVCDVNDQSNAYRVHYWFAAESGSPIGSTRQPENTADRGLFGARAARALLLMTAVGRTGEIVLVDRSGDIERLRPPVIPGAFPMLDGFDEVSASGRFAVVRVSARPANNLGDRHRSGAAILDIESNSLVWTNPLLTEAVTHREIFGLIRETERGPTIIVTRFGADCVGYARPCSGGVLVEIDTTTGRERSLRLPVDGLRPSKAEAYGPDHALIYLVAPSDPPLEVPMVAVVDLVTMSVIWTGLRTDAPPASTGSFCSYDLYRDNRPPDNRRAYRVSVQGDRFDIRAPRPKSICEVSSDGQRLLLVSPPLAHLFSIHPS